MFRFFPRSLSLFSFLIFPFLFFSVAEAGTGGAGGDGGSESGGQDGKTGAGAGGGGQPGAAAVDVQAEIAKALDAERAKFAEQFKAATGFDSLDKFQEEQAKKRGETDKLLEQRNAELAEARAELAKAHVQAAILGASADAVDPSTVLALLAPKAKFENGQVTIDGKSAAEAVKALLSEKPFLAKAGPAGSGSPQNGGGGKTLTREAFAKLTPAEQMKHVQSGGAVVD